MSSLVEQNNLTRNITGKLATIDHEYRWELQQLQGSSLLICLWRRQEGGKPLGADYQQVTTIGGVAVGGTALWPAFDAAKWGLNS